MNPLLTTLISFALALGAPQGMQPRVLLGDLSYCDAIMIRDGHITVETVCTKRKIDLYHAEVRWDGQVATIGDSDRKASEDWIHAHSVLPRLSMEHHDLYWDGKKVDLGKVGVYGIYEAFPWQGGVLVCGRTVPRRGIFESWPFKGHFIENRDLEPYCAVFFDPDTMKGEDLWLNGFANRGLFVFPIPS